MALKNKKNILKMIIGVLTIGFISYGSLIINEQEKKINECNEVIEKITNDLNKLNIQIQEKNTKIDELNKKCEEKEKENKKIKDENDKLKKEVKSIRNYGGYKITSKEVDLLEKLVYCEARGESQKGQIAVVNVVLNRLKSDEFPDTVTDVIYQKRQFSPVGNGAIYNAKPNDKIKESVQKALNGEKVVSDDTVYFFATWLPSNHAIRGHVNVTTIIGVHEFGK